MHKRVHWVDIAKAVGIFMIVLGHTVDEGTVMRYLYSFHIPLFFFLSGATFRVKGRTFGAFVKEKAKALLAPYAVFALFSQLVYVLMQTVAADVMQDGRSFSMGKAWRGLLWGYAEANRGLWFLPCLFFMGVLLYPIVKQLEENPARGRKTALAAAAASTVYTFLDAALFKIGNLPWKLDAAFKLLGFALAGWFFLHSADSVRLRQPWVRAGALALMLLGGAAGLAWNVRVRYLGSAYGNVAVFYLSSACSVLGICTLLAGLPGCRPLEYAGRRTLAILVMHKFPILFFEWVCPVVKNWLKAGILPAELLVAALAIVMCCIAERIIMKICPFVLGKFPAKANNRMPI